MRVAIVGAGLMGTWHARYAGAEGAQVVAVVDTHPERAAALARRHPGARTYRTLTESMAAVPCDAVHVCTEDDHPALAEEALEAGRHVMVEKPAATTEATARRLHAAAARKGVRLCPVHQYGFQGGFRRVVANRERLGDVVRIEASTFTAGGEGRSSRERRSILVGMVPHFVSLLHVLSGPLSAIEWGATTLTDDDLVLEGRRGETTISLAFSLRARPRRNELRVTGTAATAHLDLYHGFALVEGGAATRAGKLLAPFRHGAGLLGAATANLAGRTWHGEPAFPGLRALIGAFYRSAAGLGPAPVSAEELIESARLMERIPVG